MIDADVVVIGGGFGGSLTALLLWRIGLKPVLIERHQHPRFALGESSTPQADLILERLARDYDLPRIRPLSAWGTWQANYPDLPCGLKRGFSYFHHQPGRHFERYADHRTELLVAASHDEGDSDTHWHRATFDAFLFEEARAAGIDCLDRTEIRQILRNQGWLLSGQRDGSEVQIRSRFLIDASGDGQFLARHLSLSSAADELKTRSRCVFGHFTGLRRWEEVLESLPLADGGTEPRQASTAYPFPVDAAALHHIFPGGWMYVLPFNTGVTSAGFSLHVDQFPVSDGDSPACEWAALLARFPSIQEQFADAEVVGPPGGIVRTKRLQRFTPQAAGDDWALLPTTAGILDALHSTGNAHTLSGIERLIEILSAHWSRPTLSGALAEYSQHVGTEIRMLDQIVSGCYSAFDRFELLVTFSMFYFAGATFAEHRRRSGDPTSRRAFLCADLPEFRAAIERGAALLKEQLNGSRRSGAGGFEEAIRELIAPFNVAGLCDASRQNMYPFLG